MRFAADCRKILLSLLTKNEKSRLLPLYENGSGLVKSSVQSESKTASSFTFAVLEKAADGQYRHTLRGGFFQKCLKSSPRRGLYFPARQSYPYKSVIACVNVCLTTNFFRLTTSLTLSLGQENIIMIR